MSKIYSYPLAGLTTGSADITEAEVPDLERATVNRITIEKGSATGGTVTLFVKIKHAAAFQPLKDETGSEISISLSAISEPQNYRFAGDIEAWRITGASITGGTFNASVAGWE